MQVVLAWAMLAVWLGAAGGGFYGGFHLTRGLERSLGTILPGARLSGFMFRFFVALIMAIAFSMPMALLAQVIL